MLYKGFSTYNRSKRFAINDYEAVKQDIFNHFNIRKGEKLMHPGFGSDIWSYLFEPFNNEIRQNIHDEIRAICAYDPRIVLEDLVVEEYEHGINLRITIRFLAENLLDQMIVKFNRDTQSLTMS